MELPRASRYDPTEFRSRWPQARAAHPERWSRHEVAIGTAWLDESSDQALRVAAGIPRKHASDGLGPGGPYCPGCGAFPEMYQTWQPQTGRELESEDMVKLTER